MLLRARQLRANQTEAERALWRRLRTLKARGFHFRRQAPIGKYVVDFTCHAEKLIIELDGGQHDMPAAIIADDRRSDWLESLGYRILRFWNNDVLGNVDGVMHVVVETLRASPHP